METAMVPLQSLTVSSSEEVADASASIFTHKRIEFHLATRKNLDVFSKNNGFQVETLTPDSWRKRPAAEAGIESRSVGKRLAEGSDFGDVIADPELSFVSRIRKIGAGLENLGNTCYLNSVLQCLTYTEPLAAYLQSGKHQSSCNIAGFCALCAIQKHVIRALESSGRSLVPKDLVSNLRSISRNFRNARQEDAHEYMINLLESMHKCCLPSGMSYESPAAYEKSLVHKIFGGRLRSQVECQQCLYRSDKFDPFLDISLEITKADSLPMALRNFTASEILDGGEKHYQCLRCKEKVKAKKRLTIHNAPHVLTIHLKRFHAYDPGRKVDKKVIFGPSLDLKPFSSSSHEGNSKYSLYGVLVHFGHNTHSGHYVCFVRTSSGIWYLLNDNEVRAVSEKTVLDQKAYMLFYVRDRKNTPLQKSGNAIKKDNNVSKNGSIQLSNEQKSSVLDVMKAKGMFLFESSRPTKDSPSTCAIKSPFLPLSSPTKTQPPNPISSNSIMLSQSNKSSDEKKMESIPLLNDVDENQEQPRVDKLKDQENGVEASKLSTSIEEKTPLLKSGSGNSVDPERITSGESTTVSTVQTTGDVAPVLNHQSRCKSSGLRCYVPGGRLRSFCLLLGVRQKRKNKKLKCKMRKSLDRITGDISTSKASDSKSKESSETKNSNKETDSDPKAPIVKKDDGIKPSDPTQMNRETKREITRALTTTKVKRWDDSEFSPLFITNSFDGLKKSIGYVPDEWDEDYDRGKRRKVKQRNVRLNGINPFQIMATNNIKVKDFKFR